MQASSSTNHNTEVTVNVQTELLVTMSLLGSERFYVHAINWKWKNVYFGNVFGNYSAINMQIRRTTQADWNLSIDFMEQMFSMSIRRPRL